MNSPCWELFLGRKPVFGGETVVFYVKKRLIRRCESAIVLQLKIALSHGVAWELTIDD